MSHDRFWSCGACQDCFWEDPTVYLCGDCKISGIEWSMEQKCKEKIPRKSEWFDYDGTDGPVEEVRLVLHEEKRFEPDPGAYIKGSGYFLNVFCADSSDVISPVAVPTLSGPCTVCHKEAPALTLECRDGNYFCMAKINQP